MRPRETQDVDPAARRRAVVALCIAAVVGAVVILYLDAHVATLGDWLESDPRPPHRMTAAILGMMGLTVVPPLALGAYLWRLSERVRDAQRWPPPGMTIVRPTTVRTGAAALALGRALRLASLGLGVAALVLVLAFAQILRSMTSAFSGS